MLDLTSGRFAVQQLDGVEALSSELERLRPAELLLAEAQALLADPNAATRTVPTVLRAVVGAGTDGLPRVWAIVQYPDGSEGPITFRLVDGVWKRSVADPAYVNYDVG